jgi:dihydroorotase/N-acyl-D-amino-acid deacylase
MTVDATGMVVAPGFIDIHTHARRGIFTVPTADNYVRQGVTTLVEGPDGSSPLPIAAFLAKVDATRIVPNFATFVGQGSVREQVMGNVDRAATPDELAQMKEVVRQAMHDGAFGLSTGLLYVPGTFTPTDEVIALAKEAGLLGGIHISHMREEASGVVDSVKETIRIGEEGRLPTQVTHHKIVGKANWGRSRDTLREMEEARARGVDVTIDQYPYTASSTGISVLFPRWALEGTDADVHARIADAAQRARIKAAIVENLEVDRGGGDPRNVQIANCPWDPSLAGLTLADLVRARGEAVSFDTAAEVVIDIVRRGDAQGIFHAIDEADLRRILVSPLTMIGSDGEVTQFGEASPHPRGYGTFVRVLGRYVRDEKVLSLEEAIRKMTSFPAARLGLADRGILRPGMKADLVVFDPARVGDRATFEQPHQYAEGVSRVFVNGAAVFDGSSMSAARPGRALRGPAGLVR